MYLKTRIVNSIISQQASVKASDISGKTALHYCADNEETQCAQILLEKDISILECKDEQGYTVFTLAVLVGNLNLIKLLMEKGADINTKDNEGHKLAHWAAGESLTAYFYLLPGAYCALQSVCNVC